MNAVKLCILSILLCHAISVPFAALSGASPVHRSPQGNTMKKYMKQQKKEQKKVRKFQKRAETKWKKNHRTDH